MIDLKTFGDIVEAYLDTLDDIHKEEFYMTDRHHADAVLSALRDHLFKEHIERSARRALYEELKAEFLNQGESNT